MLSIIFLIGLLIFIIAFFTYGSYVTKLFKLNDKKETPSHTSYDGVDFVPAKTPVLFGHHFSSIAGAGPIVGPILAGLAFGWGPAILWILIGSIFLGGVHDMAALVMSIRNKGRSIAEIARLYISKEAYLIFLIFIWLTLVYVLIVFLDLTATTFAKDGTVASASIFYILLALLLGFLLYKSKLKLSWLTIVFVILIFFGIYLAHLLPLTLTKGLWGLTPKETWSTILLLYAFIASVTPVWILLQPRDYLSSFLLYTAVLGGAIGIIFGGHALKYPVFISFHSNSGSLFPILFVTIACGAISGFHSLVASGTSSKQLDHESSAKTIGYGGMLTEGLVALIALATIMIIAKGSPITKSGGLGVFAQGMGQFLTIFHLPVKFGATFGFLVLSTFLLTTLDTATRLARYTLQELFNWNIRKTRFVATLITLILPAIFAFITLKDPKTGTVLPVWKAIWPIFGATNQLLAAVGLLVASVWLIKTKRKFLFALIPMIFMFLVTLYALFLLIIKYKLSPIGIIGIILFILSLFLIFESGRILKKKT